MSDPFTLVVSAVGLASFGIQLLQGLNKYAGSALDSRDRIRAISTDIGLAVQVVQALDATIKDDANRALVNDDAERLAQEAQNQCWDIFTKIRDKLPNYSANTGSRKRDIFTWPFKKPNLELLRGNLEKVKTTLQLLMNVIILAAMTKRQAEQALLDQQRQQIEKLLEQKAAAEARLEVLERDHAQALTARSRAPTSSGHARIEPSPVIGLARSEVSFPMQEDPFQILALNNAVVSGCSSISDHNSSRGSHTSSESNLPDHPQGQVEPTPGLDNEEDLSRDDLEIESLMAELHGDYNACIQQIKALQEKLEMALDGMFVAGANTVTANPKMVGSNDRRYFVREVDRSVWNTCGCLKQRIFGTSAHQKLIEQRLAGNNASLFNLFREEKNNIVDNTHAESPGPEHILRNWFVTKDGINRQVISAEIQKYLGKDATVRPGRNKELDGYWIKAYRNLTSEMITDLCMALTKWEQEQRSGRRGTYEDSHTYRQGSYCASTNSPQLGEGYLSPNGHVPDIAQRMPVPKMEPRRMYGVPPHSAALMTTAFRDPSIYASHLPRTPANEYGSLGDFYNGHPGYAHDPPPSSHVRGPPRYPPSYPTGYRGPRDDPRYAPKYSDQTVHQSADSVAPSSDSCSPRVSQYDSDEHMVKSVHAEAPEPGQKLLSWFVEKGAEYGRLSRSSFSGSGYATRPGDTEGPRTSHQYRTSASPEQGYSPSTGSSVAEAVNTKQTRKVEPTHDEDVTMQDIATNTVSSPELDTSTLLGESHSSSDGADLSPPEDGQGFDTPMEADAIIALSSLDPVDDLLRKWTHIHS